MKTAFTSSCLICIAIFGTVRVSVCYTNIFLNPNETKRLIGLNAKLYYMKEGIVNVHASNFVIPIPTKTETLYFTWENPTEETVDYSIETMFMKTNGLYPPQLNISSTGTVPRSRETFSLTTNCTRIEFGEFDINIRINISYTSNNSTVLTLKRRKICEKLQYIPPLKLLINDNPNQVDPNNLFYFAVSFIFLISLVLSVLISFFITKSMGNDDKTVCNNNSHVSSYLNTRNSARISNYNENFRTTPSYSIVDEPSKNLQERISDLTIQRCRVRLSSVIMEGTFGRVYLGSYTTEDGREEIVMIKTVTDHASQIQISLLLQEGMSMYSLNHKNILSILRISIEDHTAPFLLFPHKNTDKNLKIFLQKCKLSPQGVSYALTTQEVVDMALQVIHGLQYLHKKHLLHKDLATRNCIVDDKLRIQITDNALSRDLFPSDYHCLGDNENRPVKWLAIESLLHKTFSVSSDIWSFGVLLWELMTLAQQPYIEVDPFEMSAYLKDGYRLAQPINCPDELFAVMAYCWAMSTEERPTLSQLQVCLQDFHTQLIRFV